MPEGDTIHKAASILRPLLVGRTLSAVHINGVHHDRLTAQPVTAVAATGKHLSIDLAGGEYQLRVHLGMNGRWRRYRAGLRASIQLDKATPSAMLPGSDNAPRGTDTTHFSVIDADGNLLAATLSVNLPYGSGFVPPGTGVLLNNEMDDFALVPDVPNAYGLIGRDANAPAPGKRMLSSMTPTFVLGDDRVAVIGTPGGSRIITMVLLGVLGYADGLSAQQVAALPRYHHQWMPDAISIERNALSNEVITTLRGMGHTVNEPKEVADGRRSSDIWGNLQTVSWDLRSNTLEGGSDPRNPVGKAQVQQAANAR